VRTAQRGASKLVLSSNIIGMIKSRRMRWTGHVAPMKKQKNVYRV
jgi:hypothetical protein